VTSINTPGVKRSSGLKLFIICFLVILMAVPAMFISYISYDRSNRADQVTQDVVQRYGGEQSILGPILVAPYHVKTLDGKLAEQGDYIVFAESGHAALPEIKSEIKQRSLYKVPIYHGEAKLSAKFQSVLGKDNIREKIIDWDSAQIIIGVSQVKGLKDDVYLTGPAGSKYRFEPANSDILKRISASQMAVSENYTRRNGFANALPGRMLAVPAGDFVSEAAGFSVEVLMKFGGATRLSILPFAQSTTARIASDWPDPGFQGDFPPISREISDTGFSAEFAVPRIALSIPSELSADNLPTHVLNNFAMTVQFVSTDNPYQTVNRALKYSVLFIGLFFLAFFLFEILVNIPVHPAQYILIGLAQSIFYLLLLAFSERIGFAGAFLISAAATIILTAAYAGAVFKGREFIWRVGLVFTIVYGLLFALMRMQDFALMIGALASFTAIAATMYLTRNIDWYGKKSPAQTASRTDKPD